MLKQFSLLTIQERVVRYVWQGPMSPPDIALKTIVYLGHEIIRVSLRHGGNERDMVEEFRRR